MVLEKNVTLAFEGCNDHTGCCPMNCTHVYNYEQAMAHLYPELERSMRETDFLVNLRPDGSMSFRTPVPLRQGGSIVIDQTEALVAIDVNSGNFRADGNAEETAYQMNLHAAKEIARQLRLRDLGGVIVNDFIDMREERHRRGVGLERVEG
jgi:hypothetical protein